MKNLLVLLFYVLSVNITFGQGVNLDSLSLNVYNKLVEVVNKEGRKFNPYYSKKISELFSDSANIYIEKTGIFGHNPNTFDNYGKKIRNNLKEIHPDLNEKSSFGGADEICAFFELSKFKNMDIEKITNMAIKAWMNSPRHSTIIKGYSCFDDNRLVLLGVSSKYDKKRNNIYITVNSFKCGR